MSLRKLLCLAVFSSVSLAPGIASAQKPSYGLQDRVNQQRSMAVNIVRAINAAEANYKKNHAVYATWSTLTSAGDFNSSGTKWSSEEFPTVAHAMYGPGPEIVPGWKLRLNLSKEGTAYDVLLEDVSDPKCGFAVFSDERGRIRQGTVVECQEQK
jgi:hypothetical protein